ncbi:MAG TPA: efflux RND transporter periplasmic adaptor subunit [Rhodocyclaceae bacterium]
MKLPSRRVGLIALSVLLAGGGGYAWFSNGNRNAAERYRSQAVESGDLTQNVSANGTLNPVTVVSVGTQVSGTVKKLHVDFNSKVEKGQVLLEIDDSLLSSQARQSEASIAAAKASLDLAAANEQRMQSLFAQEYVSKQELDQAVQAKKSAAANLAQSRAAYDHDRVNLGNTVIRAPVSGVVTDRQVDVGQTVAASFQTPTLIKIAQDLSKMQIDSSFAEADIGMIREGQPVKFNVDAFPNRSFRGAVKQIRLNPTTQSNVVTYDVVVAVDNPDQKLLPGMTAYVNIAVAERKGVLKVPNSALRFKPADAPKAEVAKESAKEGGGKPGNGGGERKKRDASQGTVWVLEGEHLTPVSVTLGITDNRNTEVVDGELKAGDRVVTAENSPGGASAKPAGGPPGRLF